MLSGNLRRTVFLLAFPVLCEQMLQFGVILTDTFLSGRLSSEATSAVGVGAYVGWLASMLFSLVGVGTTALVSRHWGAQEFHDANRVTNRSLAMASLMGVMFAAFIFVTAPWLAALLQMDALTADITVRYLRLDGVGHLFTSVTLVGAAAMRGAGDMRTPMLLLGLVNVVNIAVSFALVYGIGPQPPMGIDGIVAGTVIARFIGGALVLIALARGVKQLRIDRAEWKIRGVTVRRILRIGGPAALEGALMWAGHFVFLIVVAKLGEGGMDSDVFAAHVIGVRVEAFTYMPAFAWGTAAATLVGQSLGANLRERATAAGHEATLQCSGFAVLLSLAFFFGASAIYTAMHTDAGVRAVGTPAFRMVAFFQVPLVLSIVYVHALHGAGDTVSPLLITVIGVFGVRLPVAWVCGVVLEGGLIGAWAGMCADMLVRGILAWARFHRGKWIHTKV